MALTKIIESDFFKLLNTVGQDGSSIIKDVEVSGFIQVNPSNFKGHFTYILRCKFPDGINFSSLPNAQGIKIEDTEIGFLLFDNVAIKYGSGEVLDEGDISIRCKVIIRNSLKFNNCEVERGILITDNSEINNLQLINTHLKEDNIYIRDSTIHHNFILNKCNIEGDIWLIHSKIRAAFTAVEMKCKSYHFEDAYVKRTLIIENNELTDGIYFNGGDF